MAKLTYDDAVQVLRDQLHPGQQFGAGDMVVLSGGSEQAVKTHLSKMARQGLVAKNDDGTFTVVVDPPTLEDRVKEVVRELAASNVSSTARIGKVAYQAGVSIGRIHEMVESGSLENIQYDEYIVTGRPNKNALVDYSVARQVAARAAVIRADVRAASMRVKEIEQEIKDIVDRAGAAVWPDGIPLSDTRYAAELHRLVKQIAKDRHSDDLEEWKTTLAEAKSELEKLGELGEFGER